ncbi:MAG: NnrU family protein [Gammaproteobacteria bacterium]|nr:MAG: NnrU family protein [Gammaproteobacteria bacterium]
MTILILGLIIFLGIHLLPTFSSIRTRLIRRIGERRYKRLYSLAAITGLIVIIIGMVYRDFVPLWTPPVWGRHAAMTLMLPAIILLVAADVPSNIKRTIHHPMLWGVTLWASAHLLANGDLASLILFGSFGSYALFDMWSANRRRYKKSTRVYPASKDVKLVITGIVVYVVIIFVHPYVIGVPVIVI